MKKDYSKPIIFISEYELSSRVAALSVANEMGWTAPNNGAAGYKDFEW